MGHCGQLPCVGESCRGHGQLGRWPGAGSSGNLPGGRGQSAECCVRGIGCVGTDKETFIADAGSVAAEGDSHPRLLGTVHPVQPVVQERYRLTDIEILLQSMLPVGSVTEADVQPPAHRQESTAGCFSCGELGHATARCPVLDESFPFLPPGWRADRTEDEFVLQPAPAGAACQQAGNVD